MRGLLPEVGEGAARAPRAVGNIVSWRCGAVRGGVGYSERKTAKGEWRARAAARRLSAMWDRGMFARRRTLTRGLTVGARSAKGSSLFEVQDGACLGVGGRRGRTG